MLLAIDWAGVAQYGIPALLTAISIGMYIYKHRKEGLLKAALSQKDEIFNMLIPQVKAAIAAGKKMDDAASVAVKLVVENMDAKLLDGLSDATKDALDIAAAPIKDIVSAELAKAGVLDDSVLKTLVKSVNADASTAETMKTITNVATAVATTAANIAT